VSLKAGDIALGDPQEEPEHPARTTTRSTRSTMASTRRGAAGGAHLRAHRAGVEPRAPHAVARVPAARHVGRGGRPPTSRRSPPRWRSPSARGCRRAVRLPQPVVAALRVSPAGKVREGARAMRRSEARWPRRRRPGSGTAKPRPTVPVAAPQVWLQPAATSTSRARSARASARCR
jgi:hypothetical protein